MKLSKNEMNRIMHSLSQAWQKRETPETTPGWDENLMNDIRRTGRANPKTPYLASVENLAWRLAPVSAVLLVIVSAFILGIDFTPDVELVKYYMSDPVEFTVSGIWGM